MIVDHSPLDMESSGALVDIIVDHEPTVAVDAVEPEMIRSRGVANQSITVITVQALPAGRARTRNLGATFGRAPIIGFLDARTTITGDWERAVRALFADRPDLQLLTWLPFTSVREAGHVRDVHPREVAAGALFLRRSWFERDQFDEQFHVSHEQRDLARRVLAKNLTVAGVTMPFVLGAEPWDDGDDQYYRRKWALK